MGAFNAVDDFEDALARYTGAPYVVTVDSCTNAIFLALLWWKQRMPWEGPIDVPRHTYVGVSQVARNAGYEISWTDEQWEHEYRFDPLPLWDSAKRFERGMHEPGHMRCVSFHIGKRLPLGRGGAILLDDPAANAWLRRARFDGRTAGETGEDATHVTTPGWHMYLSPPDAARGLWLLEQFVDRPLNDAWFHYPDVSVLLGEL